MAEAGDLRGRLRAVARALARGERPAAGGPAADGVVTLDAAWPAARADGFWRATPPWPEGYPPAHFETEAEAAVALDVESMGRTPKPLFLVGLARVGAGGVAFEQFVAAHPEEEAAVLAATGAALAAAPLLLTYNGLTFDLPLIRDRMQYWRLRYEPPRRHVDLLWTVRRHYRRKLAMPWCGLAEAERYILGLARPDDLPSSQVPELYERAIQAGDARPLIPVLRHNLYDLAALVLLYLKVSAELPAALAERGPPAEEAALF